MSYALPFEGARNVLQDFRYFESNELDETRERITAILQTHQLLPRKRSDYIHSHMDFLQLSGLGFSTLRYGTEMAVEVCGLADYYVIIFCLRGAGQIKTRDSEIEIGQRYGFASTPGQTFRAVFSADCEQFIVRIDRNAMKAHAGESCIRLDPKVDLVQPALRPWLTTTQGLLGERLTVDLARKDGRIGKEYEQLLLSLLLEGQPYRTDEKIRLGSLAPTTVRRAERFIYDHLAEPITLQDIAQAAGVPPRTLLEGFRRFRGISPIKFLREERFRRARNLLYEQGSNCGVSDVAIQCGFHHLGRFAQEYRARFGERPSDSAVRHKSRGY